MQDSHGNFYISNQLCNLLHNSTKPNKVYMTGSFDLTYNLSLFVSDTVIELAVYKGKDF